MSGIGTSTPSELAQNRMNEMAEIRERREFRFVPGSMSVELAYWHKTTGIAERTLKDALKKIGVTPARLAGRSFISLAEGAAVMEFLAEGKATDGEEEGKGEG